MAAYIAHDHDRGQMRSVRELVTEFRGLSGSAKGRAILEETGLARAPLTTLANGRDLDHAKVAALLEAMQRHSKPVKPETLGIIGRAHFEARFAAYGAEPESFDYRVVKDTVDGVPSVLEAAFAWLPQLRDRRVLVSGINWSPGMLNPFRELGPFGTSLDTILTEQRAGQNEPIILVTHLTSARVEYMDRGKSAVATSEARAAKIVGAIQAITKKWAKQRKAEERHAAAVANRRTVMTRRRTTSIRAAAFGVMESAYRKVSDNGKLPALARQIMYAARPTIQRDVAPRELGDKFDKYFTQGLLPDFVAAYPQITAEWNVVFDARGSFIEPHTENRVPLGTLNVRAYLAEIRDHAVEEPDFDIWERHYPTIGPANRFGAILFVEKEGFDPLFEAVKLAQRHDLAIMSTKGMSVTASRELVEYVCGLGVPLLVLHDFDKSGFSIVGTLRRSTRRYRFGRGHASRVIDLGLRLEDVAGLETEDVYLRPSAAANLRQNGATPEEIAFLLERRVELNAFTSRGLIDWLERKLEAHGIKKVVRTRIRWRTPTNACAVMPWSRTGSTRFCPSSVGTPPPCHAPSPPGSPDG